MTKEKLESIRLKGVRQNNLKGFDLDLPLGKLIVVTGLSGTGKSSLVFETLHAEGQRRYVETFSPYTRQFLEIMDRPKVDSVENIRPSIAIQQTNTVKTSRSTVGTMTELCDYFKVWFCHVSSLFDPETGEKIESDNPETIWKKVQAAWDQQEVLICFTVKKPEKLKWEEILTPLVKQGYIRAIVKNQVVKLEDLTVKSLAKADSLVVIQDRVRVDSKERARFMESVKTGLHFGDREIQVYSLDSEELGRFSEGLHSPKTGRRFDPASPAVFSFNSPIGACPKCNGFGRVIEIDYNLVFPDTSLSIEEGVIRPFHGEVYQESLNDLLRAAKRLKIRTNVAWNKLTQEERDLVLNGEPAYISGEKEWPDGWYGVKGFFDWMESKRYKMHVRVMLAKYRAYTTCPECQGSRLKPAALLWKWKHKTLPELYAMSLKDLAQLMERHHKVTGNHPVDLAADGILSRLRYLNQVGLGYLTLDRASRTLSGGEVERVNLTTCLGTSLVETLFVLDEPSVGLHARDIDRLIDILKRLTGLGNTVVVVEHDEAIMRAADQIIELGPEPGSKGGNIVYQGSLTHMGRAVNSITGKYLSGEKDIPLPRERRDCGKKYDYFLELIGVTKNNIKNQNFKIPLERLVCVAGVSGSGKSTFLNNVLFQGLQAEQGKLVEDPAVIKTIKSSFKISEVAFVDQGPITKTPRSNPALYVDAWDGIRQLFAQTYGAMSMGMTASDFSFNSGNGRCEHCHGLGYEQVEMQFLSDVFVTCPVCEGQRFKPEVLQVKWKNKNISEILHTDVRQALELFWEHPKIVHRLQALVDVGLEYLTLGQPLNTLSGGESQRLKLVKYFTRLDDQDYHTLLLLDEPTTGLHRDDIRRLITVLQKLVNQGHSLVVIEHQMDVLKCADWVIELGPDAGSEGGRVIAEGTPEMIAGKTTETARFILEALEAFKRHESGKLLPFPTQLQKAAETQKAFGQQEEYVHYSSVNLIGAREHNLKDISITIPHRQLTVLTGVSGSGKSSLAFDIIFAEGQRRFMESISAYARQFIEQMPRPDIDQLTGIAPTVAIEQRVTRGSRKSTVATVTEVAQYLRLLFARIGIQHSPTSGKAVISQTPAELFKRMEVTLKEGDFSKEPHLYLCAPVIRGRKGHHEPVANWARSQSFTHLRIDGKVVALEHFKRLDRYKEHDIEVVIADLGTRFRPKEMKVRREFLEKAIKVGNGSCFLFSPRTKLIPQWFSTTRTDPETGEAFPELDPKHFSWNSSKGWCPTCRGHGRIYSWMDKFENAPLGIDTDPGTLCPDCKGARLNPISRAVKLYFSDNKRLSLPELFRLTPSKLLDRLKMLKLNKKEQQIIDSIQLEIQERLKFLDQVGLNYLSLDRSSNTLSGGEAQRIRLAAQLSSNLSGVLYVLDEPSIGLHAVDNERLINSLKSLRDKGNTLLVVEHDDDTMREADNIIDLGPSAGIHGGEVLACGPVEEILKNPLSLTGKYLREGIPHPINGKYRKLPKLPKLNAKKLKSDEDPQYLALTNASLRNLKGDTLYLPLGRLTMVCGISGAGKSTMIRDLLRPAVEFAIEKNTPDLTGETFSKNAKPLWDDIDAEGKPVFGELLRGNAFKKVIEVDQEPIGKTPRSTPATYIGAFDIIRNYFATLPEAKIHGLSASHFSFNTKDGRCATCSGVGRVKLEMNFLPDTFVTCEACGGSRYGSDLQEIRWNGKNIGEILQMSFEEGVQFFHFHSRLKALMELMVDTGLGYLNLGQISPTLSGGEAQRLKLVSELAKGLPTFKEKQRNIHNNNLYILEEPTIGLHLSDCERLIHLLHRLVDQGHTVVVIEHNLDLLAEADYIVEVGPEGGENGGRILYQGDIKGLAGCKESKTARFLRDKLKG